MKIIILGNDVAALVAAFAVHTKMPTAALGILSVDQWGRLAAPIQNEVIPAVIPPLMDYVATREITVMPSGSPDRWADKVGGRPDKIPEYFPAAGSSIFHGHLVADMFSALAFGSGLARLVQAWDQNVEPLETVVGNIKPDLIINTMNRAFVCVDNDHHTFTNRPVYLSYKVGPNIPNDSILVNSEDAPAFYTSSKFDNIQVTKWLDPKPPFSGIIPMPVPLTTNCDCAPHGLVHVGSEAHYNPALTLIDVWSDSVAALMAVAEKV